MTTQEEEASTSGSEDDDEAMEASGMDAKIAAVLRATADAKESGRKAKEAVSQLRFRVRHNICTSAFPLHGTLYLIQYDDLAPPGSLRLV